MKARWWMALIFTAAAWAAEPAIEFVGVIGSAQKYEVGLRKKDGEVRWTPVGKTFADYTVASYDPKQETVVLTRGTEELRLRLRASKVAAGAAPAAPLTPPQRQAITNNLRQLSAAADQYYLENGKASATYDDLVGPTKYVKQLAPQVGEDYRTIVFAQGKAMELKTPSGETLTYAP